MRRPWKWKRKWLSCVMCLGWTATVHAQTAEPAAAAQPTISQPAVPPPATSPPATAQPATAAPPTTAQPSAASTSLPPWQSLQGPEPATGPRATQVEVDGKIEPKDPAGSLGWEIAGGMIPLVTGVGLVILSLDPGHGGHVPSFRVNTPMFSIGVLLAAFGPPGGVAIAGNASGGTGTAGYAYLGALAGLPLSVPGILIGSIVGYRLSADDEPAKPAQCVWQPILTRDQIALQVSGRL